MSRTKIILLSLPLALLLAGTAWFFVPVGENGWTETEVAPVAFSIENKRNKTNAAFGFVAESWRDDKRKDARVALKNLYLDDLKDVLDAARLNNERNVLILEQRYGYVLNLMQSKSKKEEVLKAISSLKTITLLHLDELEPQKSDPVASNNE